MSELKITYKPLKDKEGNVYKEKWPYIDDLKAISPSTLTMPIGQLVYGISPPGFTHSGMTDGHEFESALDLFLTSRDLETAKKFISNEKLHQRFEELATMIVKEWEYIQFERNIIGYYKLDERFFACECDFIGLHDNYKKGIILEIKKTNVGYLSPRKLKYLEYMYKIQCYLQMKSFESVVYICWASDKFVKIEKFDLEKEKAWMFPLMSKLWNTRELNKDIESQKYRIEIIKDFIERLENGK